MPITLTTKQSDYVVDSALRGTIFAEKMQEIANAVRSANAGNALPADMVGGQVTAHGDTGMMRQAMYGAPGTLINLWSVNGRPNAIIPVLVSAAGTYAVTPGGANHIFVDSSAGAVVILLPSLTAAGAVPMFAHVLHIAGLNAVTVKGDGQAIGQYDSTAGVLLPKIGDYVSLWTSPQDWATWQFYADASRGVRTVTTTAAVNPTDSLILADTTGGAFVLTLCAAADYHGDELVIKHTGSAANLTLDPNGAEAIDSLGAGMPIVDGTQDARVRLRSDGTQWYRVD